MNNNVAKVSEMVIVCTLVAVIQDTVDVDL